MYLWMDKSICFTIDIEPDFGGLLKKDVYFGKRDLHRLQDLVNKYDIKLTAFVTGKTLEENPEILDMLLGLGVEIESHSYYHNVGHTSKILDIDKGIETHTRLLGKPPLGYRAPQGIITSEEVEYLTSRGVKFDSSIFPAFFPGRFNRLKFPKEPFLVGTSGMLEIPFSVVPKIRLPIGLGYIQLFGLNTFKVMFRLFGLPKLIIFDFHSYELGRVPSYDNLPILDKLGYFRAQKLYTDPFKVLEEFVVYTSSRGYVSKNMAQVYDECKDKSPQWDWN